LGVYLIIPLIEVALCLTMLALLVFLGRRHVARKPFALFLFWMTLWGLFIFLMRFTPNLIHALLWERLRFFFLVYNLAYGNQTFETNFHSSLVCLFWHDRTGTFGPGCQWNAVHVVRESPCYWTTFCPICFKCLYSHDTGCASNL
jgi:hypothetical protein